MIKVKLPHRTFGFSFRHTDVSIPEYVGEVGRARMNKDRMRKTKATYCTFFEIDEGKSVRWLVDGIATVGVGDQFDKWMGRKISLSRAIDQLKERYSLTRDESGLIWDAYWNRGIIEGEVLNDSQKG